MAVELKDLTKVEDNYSKWYNELVVKAGLAENSAVRGCMVIKPYGYSIWEKMHKKMIEKGAEKLARDINAFQPTRIIYVDGNSTLLYENYVSKHIKAGCPVIALPNIPKTSLSPFGASKVVSTNKFIINVDSCTFTSDERVVIFDDITKTGETIKELKKYLIDDCKLSPLNILTCGFITDKFGYANSAEPGFYFLRTEVKDGYRFPWRLS